MFRGFKNHVVAQLQPMKNSDSLTSHLYWRLSCVCLTTHYLSCPVLLATSISETLKWVFDLDNGVIGFQALHRSIFCASSEAGCAGTEGAAPQALPGTHQKFPGR
jgi:hypothetical protein